jgi:hypothetical protein
MAQRNSPETCFNSVIRSLRTKFLWKLGASLGIEDAYDTDRLELLELVKDRQNDAARQMVAQEIVRMLTTEPEQKQVKIRRPRSVAAE